MEAAARGGWRGRRYQRGGSNSGGSGGSGGCDPTGGGETGTCPEYVACTQSECDAQYHERMGAGYKTGNFTGGKREAYMKCTAACNCDTTCLRKCTPDPDCMSCMTGSLGSCVTSNCSVDLQKCSGGSGGSTGSGGATGNGTCADLQACCSKMSGADKTSCENSCNQVKAGGDAACGMVFQGYKGAGKC